MSVFPLHLDSERVTHHSKLGSPQLSLLSPLPSHTGLSAGVAETGPPLLAALCSLGYILRCSSVFWLSLFPLLPGTEPRLLPRPWHLNFSKSLWRHKSRDACWERYSDKVARISFALENQGLGHQILWS